MSGWDAGDYGAVAIGAVLICVGLYLLHRAMSTRKPTRYGAAPVAYGLDFSWGRPSAEAILAAGYTFVLRYLSWSTSGKNLTAEEARYYQTYGIGIGSNWEYYADAPKNGYPQGASDATEGVRQHAAVGGSVHDPIYFSVDYDAQMGKSTQALRLFEKTGIGRLLPWWLILKLDGGFRTRRSSLWKTTSDYDAVTAYFRGIIDVIGLARCGAYGSYQVIRQLFNDGLITFGWQTYAWSHGYWDGRAQLRQVKNGIVVGGAEVDRNEQWHNNAGLWGQNEPVRKKTGDGAVLLNCPFDDARQDLLYVGPNNEVWHRWWDGGMNAMWNGDGGIENLGGKVVQGTLTAMWTPNGQTLYVAGVGSPDNNAPAGTGTWWGMTLDRYGSRSGWGSFEQTWGALPGGTVVRTEAPENVKRLHAVVLIEGIAAIIAISALAVALWG